MRGVMTRKFDRRFGEIAKGIGVHTNTLKRWVLKFEKEFLKEGVMRKEDRVFYIYYSIEDSDSFLKTLKEVVKKVKERDNEARSS